MTVQFETPIAHHIGFAVYNADSAAKRYQSMLGAKMRLMPPYVLTNMYGEPAELRVYYGAVAGLAIEIIEVTKGTTCHNEWLRQHGEGIQHIGLWVPDVRAATADLVSKGGRVEWIYSQADGAGAGLSAASTNDEVLAAVSNNGLTYLDIKEGGAQIEFIGPTVQQSIYGAGGSLNGLEDFINQRPPGQKAER